VTAPAGEGRRVLCRMLAQLRAAEARALAAGLRALGCGGVSVDLAQKFDDLADSVFDLLEAP
jgi:hypothetical protein